jgi:hypothetical protein
MLKNGKLSELLGELQVICYCIIIIIIIIIIWFKEYLVSLCFDLIVCSLVKFTLVCVSWQWVEIYI